MPIGTKSHPIQLAINWELSQSKESSWINEPWRWKCSCVGLRISILMGVYISGSSQEIARGLLAFLIGRGSRCDGLGSQWKFMSSSGQR
ncbi:hypothetical protein TNCV_3349861 [Trichonephila clavipes]|nr:hypothetical protein TNCV_3349861 [Trichonephila clavipes]